MAALCQTGSTHIFSKFGAFLGFDVENGSKLYCQRKMGKKCLICFFCQHLVTQFVLLELTSCQIRQKVDAKIANTAKLDINAIY